MTPWTETPICLVTGAAHGLGIEVAVELARRGGTVLIAGRDPAAAARAAADRRGDTDLRALETPLDITDAAQVAAAAEAVRAAHGRLDVLVNNAAGYVDWTETASGADLEKSRAVMDVNLYGTWRVIQAFLPLLRASEHPRVVNVASGAGSHGDPDYGLTARGGTAASYGISKAALLALTASLAAEWAQTPLVVNAVDPDLTATWPGAESTGARPAAESAPGVVWAATLPDDGPRGGFFRDAHPHPW
ncbi:SDR family NAD(P)-dependent oxidoreductase [Actinoplanes sp. CA-030573]|uniref:SDR family NAD(P)-dependent oxidoreductase n=1 Tax=Actinoplanes sp. CA-030573 TaxID=3239898 RepID=UPI003D8BE738